MAQTLIPQASGTRTSNASGRLDKWFDGINNGSTGADTFLSTPTNSLNMRVDWGSGQDKIVTGFKAYSTNDQGFSDSDNPTETVELWGSTDNFAASAVLLGSISGTDDTGLILSKMSGIITTTAYRYHEIRLSVASNINTLYCVEAEFYQGVPSGFSQAIICG